jgi:uncharacterized protein (DUF362 family)/NAD-dependent dihydropyrimidine dehydrogenase PreA subunit
MDFIKILKAESRIRSIITGARTMDVSVHITRCEDYELDILGMQIREHLDRQVKFNDISGKKVLLKLNLLSARDPENAVTTHPQFVKALVMELIERGAAVTIADSPGGLFTKGALEKVYGATGISKIAKETGADLNFNTDHHTVRYPRGRFTKTFKVCDYVKEHDLIIAVPKVKTHMLCGLTCATKIMYGIVPGTEKVKYHTRFPDPVDFSKMLIDLTDASETDLFLVDGIIGMDGKGPAQGRPRKVGAIISSTDPLAIDLHISRMVGLKPDNVPILQAGFELGRISEDEQIELTGNGKDIHLKERFIPASGGVTSLMMPRPIRRTIINLTTRKPKISHKKCVGCGVCRDNCAGDAIKIKNSKARIEYSKCIRCYCCHELCPHDAVYLNMRETGLPDRLIDIVYHWVT